MEQAQALCGELDIADRVTFLGWIGEAERTNQLYRAGILALPSFQEGLPMGILEAMKFGLAVVTTPVGGIPDVLQDGYNGLLVPPGNAEMLAQAIRRLFDDEALQARIGAMARSSVAVYEPAVLANEWKSLYRHVLSEMQPGSETK